RDPSRLVRPLALGQPRASRAPAPVAGAGDIDWLQAGRYTERPEGLLPVAADGNLRMMGSRSRPAWWPRTTARNTSESADPAARRTWCTGRSGGARAGARRRA